jgi:hypothetical protein
MSASLPANLDRLFFTRMGVFANPEWNQEDQDPTLQLDLSLIEVVRLPGSERAFACTQRIRHDGPKNNNAYSLDLECIALLHFTADMSEEDQERRAYMLGHSVLYGACREAVLAASSRQVWGPFTIGFSVLANGANAAKQPEPATDTPPPG